MLEGELVVDAGRETVGPGTCIGFPAGTGDGHHFLNLTQKDAIYLVIGDRTGGDEVDLHRFSGEGLAIRRPLFRTAPGL